jgi:thiamine biosynthesis lipoprotein
MSLALVFLLTLAVFSLAVAAMAVGVIFGRRAIRGSCGGLGNGTGEEGACSLCTNPDAACRELRRRSRGGSSALESQATKT